MLEGWLAEDQSDDFIDVIDPGGEVLGYLLRWEALRLRLIPQLIETPDRYLTDPYILHHVRLIDERQLYKDGRDLNDVQLVLVLSNLINHRKTQVQEKDRFFEESMYINNPEMWKEYTEEKDKKQEEDGGVFFEQRVPGSVEEFLATIAAFSEDVDSGSDKGRDAEGWLSSFLDPEDLAEMGD